MATNEKGGRIRWSSDESILLLDLYLRHSDTKNAIPNENHEEVKALSNFLRKINNSGNRFGKRHRNPTGIAMQLQNYRTIDPNRQGGLANVAEIAKYNWNTYIGKKNREKAREEIRLIAHSIRKNLMKLSFDAPEVHDGAVLLESDTDYIVAEAREGRILTKLHIRRERNRKLVKEKKEQAQDKNSGRLECEACTFDFAKRYGDRGKGFIEVHHTRPLHTLTQSSIIKLNDLALLCSNCHRIVHREKHHWLTMQELHTLVETHRAASH